MKLLLTVLLGLLACSSYAAPTALSAEQELQSIADFLERVKEIYSTLKARGADFVCSAKLQELLDILGLPNELDGAVQMAQSWLCGGSDDVVTSVATADIALQGWTDKIKEIYSTLKTYGYDLVCGASLHELMDILGLPDQLDGTVSMIQGWICSDEGAKMTKREVAMVGGFTDWFWDTVATLKEYGTGIVCTAKLQDLMDLLGLPDLLDGAVKMAQEYVCGGEGLKTTSLQNIYVSGFIDTVKRIFASFKTYGYDLVCGASLHELLDILGLPDQLDGAVTMAQGWFCDEDEVVPEMKRSPLVITPAMKLAVVQGFYDTVQHMYELLKRYVVSFVCSAKLHELLDLLGVPDDLDGAVSLAQKMICGLTSTALASADDMRGFFDTVQEIFYKLVEMSQAYVCGADISAIVQELGLPESLTWAVNVAVGWICN